MSICQREFRSCERRRRCLLGPNYKHSTPNGVKPVLSVTGSIKTPGRVRFQPKSCANKKQELYEIAAQRKTQIRTRLSASNAQTVHRVFDRRATAGSARHSRLREIVFQYDEHLPLVTIRVFDPGLVQYRIAAGSLHFVASAEPGGTPFLPEGEYILG